MEISKQAERGEEIRVNGEKAQVIETTATATTDEMAAEVDDEEKEKTEAVQEGLFGGDRF